MTTLDIEIFRGKEVWLVKLSGNSDIHGAFCTDALPTAFRLEMPACQVKARLRQLNPGARITFLEEVDER